MHEAPATHADELVVSTETTSIQERVVVSPTSGRFVPLPPETFATEGEWVERHQVLAEVRNGSEAVPVRSEFRGWMMGMLAIDGQPVHQGEALFWIRES